MTVRNSKTLFLAAAILASSCGLQAQEGDKQAPEPKAPAKVSPKAKSVSEGTAAMLAAGLPTYDPPKPPPQVPEDTLVDLRDVDKPKNGIIRLPKYVVRPPKVPIFREQDIYTPKGLADLAVKRYLSELDAGVLNRFVIPLFGTSNETRALEQYREDQRLANMADLKDTADSARRGGDVAESEYLKRESQETYVRSFDWGGPIPGK